MHHAIPTETLGPEGAVMAHAIEKCVHCGFCLPACPTYRILGEEMDSPRGRILLMKSGLEGSVAVADTLPFIDRCLGCLACVPACPSGVPYGELLPLYRNHANRSRHRSTFDRLRHALIHHTLSSAGWARTALRGARLAKSFTRWLPQSMAQMVELAPDSLPAPAPLPAFAPAIGQRRARVALLEGCVQSAMAPQIGWATLRVLTRNGVEVVVPKDIDCCGALAMHAGELELARQLAGPALISFPDDIDAIVTNAAGCGSAMKEYGVLFTGRNESARAATCARRVRDVTEVLASLGLVDAPAFPAPLKVAYHDACHLAHAQGVTGPPRELLGQIANVTLVDIEEGDVCCGSAGTYNLEQPALAATLGERKAQRIARTNADLVAAGNIGCIVQIDSHLKRIGRSMPVLHTIEIIDRAYSRSQVSSLRS